MATYPMGPQTTHVMLWFVMLFVNNSVHASCENNAKGCVKLCFDGHESQE